MLGNFNYGLFFLPPNGNVLLFFNKFENICLELNFLRDWEINFLFDLNLDRIQQKGNQSEEM